MHPDIDRLWFVGLLQPLGAVMPLAEAQGEWVADEVEGRYARPSREAMLRDIGRENEAMAKRYVASKRHTMQVDFDDHLADVRRERRRRRVRARQAVPA
jgi:dimethylaniline monooxygenase (N-oxide forming)